MEAVSTARGWWGVALEQEAALVEGDAAVEVEDTRLEVQTRLEP